MNTPLVSPSWLHENLDRGDVKIVDASWRMPGMGNAFEDFIKRHIPGAVFFDIDKINDHHTSLPHMLPTEAVFENAIGKMGIGNSDNVVVYDDQGIFSSPRVWWTFRCFGHRNVAVLDGGLTAWQGNHYPVTNKSPAQEQKPYTASLNKVFLSNAIDIRRAISAGDAQILDARPADRFDGDAPEPRPGLRSGHMPHAQSIPFDMLINPDGTMKAANALAALFEKTGVKMEAPIITSCGSGITAAVISLALERVGHLRNSLYDGAWSEWADLNNDINEFPVAKREF